MTTPPDEFDLQEYQTAFFTRDDGMRYAVSLQDNDLVVVAQPPSGTEALLSLEQDTLHEFRITGSFAAKRPAGTA